MSGGFLLWRLEGRYQQWETGTGSGYFVILRIIPGRVSTLYSNNESVAMYFK
jgi:hypothetical protein